jgi:hypothetical protein
MLAVVTTQVACVRVILSERLKDHVEEQPEVNSDATFRNPATLHPVSRRLS